MENLTNGFKIDKKVVINIYLNRSVEGILYGNAVTFKVIDRYQKSVWIDNPVFTYTVVLVIVQFFDVIIGCISWGYNFDNKVRRTIAAFSIQFIFIADNHQVRLYNRERAVI